MNVQVLPQIPRRLSQAMKGITFSLPAQSPLIHMRFLLTAGETRLRSLDAGESPAKLGAMFTRLSCLCAASLALVSCSDSEPPSWGDGAELSFEVSGSSIVVSWPEANDNIAVTSIAVTMGLDEVTLDGDARSHTFDGLDDNTDYAFSVTAIDEAGLESETLTGEASTLDLTGPVFAAGARLSFADGALSWPEATDENGVASYQVLKDGDEVASVSTPGYVLPAAAMAEIAVASVQNTGDDESGEQEGADPERMRDLALEQYVVVALDEAGNRSLFLRGDGSAQPEETEQAEPNEPRVAPAAIAPAQLDPAVREVLERHSNINSAVHNLPVLIEAVEMPN